MTLDKLPVPDEFGSYYFPLGDEDRAMAIFPSKCLQRFEETDAKRVVANGDYLAYLGKTRGFIANKEGPVRYPSAAKALKAMREILK